MERGRAPVRSPRPRKLLSASSQFPPRLREKPPASPVRGTLQATSPNPHSPASHAKTSPIRTYVVPPTPRGTSTTTDAYVVVPLGREASKRPRESLTVTSP